MKRWQKEELEINDTTMPEELVDSMLQLQQYDSETARVVSEHDFRNKYLELLTNTAGKVDLTPWLQVCGTAYEPVNIVKDGKTIFTVPPLLQRHPTLSRVDSRFSSTTIVAEARGHASRLPHLGFQHLVNNMSEKVILDGVDYGYVKQWNEILAYYGKPVIEVPQNLLPADEQKALGAPVDETTFGDDDFEEC